MGVHFNGFDRIQRGRGVGGLLKIAAKLFAPLGNIVKKAITSTTGKKVVDAVKTQAIDSSINLAKDIARGENVGDSLQKELKNVKASAKRKAIDIGTEYLKKKFNNNTEVKKRRKPNKKKIKGSKLKRRDILD
jgi:hypothetical protein